MRLVEYKKDETVYREGEAGGSFHVIVSGRFEAFLAHGERKKVLAYLKRGDYFGEMSLLTDEPHSATIRALSDSLVLELKKDDFKKTIEHNATVSLELSRRLSARLKVNDSRSKTLFKCDVISVLDPEKKSSASDFSLNLAASLLHETHQKTILIEMSEAGAEISHFQDISQGQAGLLAQSLKPHPAGFDLLNLEHLPKEMDEQALITLLNHLAVDYRFVVMNLPSPVDETVFKAMTQSDLVFLVTNSHMNSLNEIKGLAGDLEKNQTLRGDKIAVVIHEVVFGVRTTPALKKELFGSRRCFSLPAPPADELTRDLFCKPFVIRDPELEYSRNVRHIARYLSNNLVGLALGSGAALGLAHIGVLKVLERERIPVDIVAGSSIGSLVGSLYALDKDVEQVEKSALQITGRFMLTRLIDFNLLPWRGLLHGQQIVKQIGKHLKNKTFEDCRVALKIVTANLSTRQIQVVDSGPLLSAVRASIAIPAIFKPVIRRQDVIVDGGILSPLPIRALHQAGAHKVIAVNVFPSSQDMIERRLLLEEQAEKERSRAERGGWLLSGLLALKRAAQRKLSPNIFDILMMTIQAMEAEIADVEGEEADLLLRPVVPNASWVELYKPGQFIQRGEEEALKFLPKIKALVAQQNI